MTSYARKMAVGVFSAALCLTAVATPAEAANQQQNGLVNVAVGDVTLTDVADIGVAAQVAAQVCGLKVGPVAVLGAAVDRTGVSRTVCTSPQGPVTINQV